MITNLLGNAVRYTPPEGEIAVAACREGPWAVVRVRDTGEGIAPELLPRVFDPFTQIPAVGRARGVGLGIGLALVQRLVALHGGTVEARSQGRGRGSEFEVRLPLSGPIDAVLVAPAAPALRSSSILVVEDDADTREMLRLTLELDGHRVDVAADGIRAIEVAAASRPEVVLIDIGLPGIDGYEVARRIRQALGPDVLLVALTGFGRDEDLERARRAGFDAHLLKPVEGEQLRRVIAEGRRAA